MTRSATSQITAAYLEACRLDVEAFKPGNVSLRSAGHRMYAGDFLRSAACSASAISRSDATLGQRIFDAVSATRQHVGCNTNLGILLLVAPLAQARLDHPAVPLRKAVETCLSAATLEDAALVYRAISKARPGGLGVLSEHDVSLPPRIGLVESMQQAADRDLIARQYATGFLDLFEQCEPQLAEAIVLHDDLEHAVVDLYLYLLTVHPDSHVQRRHGVDVAREVSRMARPVHRTYRDAPHSGAALAMLDQLDRSLKKAHINPGTSADLCVATLFSYCLKQRAGNDARSARDNQGSAGPPGVSDGIHSLVHEI